MLAQRPSPSDLDHDDAVDAEAMADYRAGRVISHKAILGWVKSWGTPDELSPPQVGD